MSTCGHTMSVEWECMTLGIACDLPHGHDGDHACLVTWEHAYPQCEQAKDPHPREPSEFDAPIASMLASLYPLRDDGIRRVHTFLPWSKGEDS